MNNTKTFKLLLLGVASMGMVPFAYSADGVTQTPPCSQQPQNQPFPMCPQRDDDGVLPPPPPEGCPMMDRDGQGRMGMMQGPRDGHFGGRRGDDGCMVPPDAYPLRNHDAALPREIRDRIDALRTDRKALRDLWEKAVLARGDKAVDALRADFAKANAELIAKIDKTEKSIRDDIEALHEGYGKNGKGRVDDESDGIAPKGKGFHQMPGPDADNAFAKVDADIVAAIAARKEPLTVEEYRRIRDEAIEKNREELDNAMHKGPMYGMHGDPMRMRPPMPPELAQMRDEMGHMRGNFQAKHEMRNRMREAMKIQDPAKREAAVKAILDSMPDDDVQNNAPETKK